MPRPAPLTRTARALVGAFVVSGTVHLVKPDVFRPLMPAWVPAHREVIVGSGVAELVCAAGLLLPATRRPAGIASAALLLGVLPGNVKMALDAQQGRSPVPAPAAWARLPLQLPLVRAAWHAGRD